MSRPRSKKGIFAIAFLGFLLLFAGIVMTFLWVGWTLNLFDLEKNIDLSISKDDRGTGILSLLNEETEAKSYELLGLYVHNPTDAESKNNLEQTLATLFGGNYHLEFSYNDKPIPSLGNEPPSTNLPSFEFEFAVPGSQPGASKALGKLTAWSYGNERGSLT